MIDFKTTIFPSMPATTHLWTRLTSKRHEDAWIERLRFAGPESLVIKAFPASRTLRLDLYTNHATGKRLVKNFGGTLRPFNMATWTPPSTKRHTPLRIASTLCLYDDRKSFLTDQKKTSPKKQLSLFIPAGMAFGTGEHATTANCLRLLCKIAKTLSSNNWSLLDLGSGSGILALAGELLGAKKILGLDFDKQCVSISKENASANKLPRSRFRHANLLNWKPAGSWNVIAANVYSSVLTTVAPKIVAALAPQGHLILSGILTVEQESILSVFTQLNLKKITVLRRGKWCAIHLQKNIRVRLNEMH